MAQVVTYQSAQSSPPPAGRPVLRGLNILCNSTEIVLVLISNVVVSGTRHHLSCNTRRTKQHTALLVRKINIYTIIPVHNLH